MPCRITMRFQFDPEAPPEAVRQALETARGASASEALLFFFAEELNEGHETVRGVREWVAASRPYREALERAGIRVSLNPWHSLLHTDRGRRLKPGQAWQRMVDPDGREAEAVVCPLDPCWRRYFLRTLKIYAREGFRVVWIDDDIRYHNHAPLRWGGCFCPLHVDAFRLRAGARASREEIVAACLQPGPPHPWRALWLDMWEETILEFLRECRRTLEAGGAKMGLMTSDLESHAAEGRRWRRWWEAFGGHAPVHRPHFWAYSEGTAATLVRGIAMMDQNRAIQPEAAENAPEIENLPYGPWNKPFRQVFAQMAVAQVFGASNLLVSLFDFMGNRMDDEPGRMAFLKRVRPNLDWLADAFPPSLQSVGAGIPWSEDMGRALRTETGASWWELACPSRGWASWLGAAGIAFSSRAQPGVNALAGPVAWSLGDGALEQWLASGLLLDGEAAAILCQRGLGPSIGVNAWRRITQRDTLYSMESCRAGPFALRAGARMSLNDSPHACRLFQGNLDPAAILLGDLLSPRGQIVGHGVYLYSNAAGGRVAVTPWQAARGLPLMEGHRAAQLRRIVSWLGGGRSPGCVEGGAWLVPQFFRGEAGWRGVVWNAGADDVESVSLTCPDGMPPVREAWHVSAEGFREAARNEAGGIRTRRPFRQWDLVALM